MTREKDKRKKDKIKRIWSIKCIVIPVIIRVTGIVAKGVKKNEKDTTGKYFIYLVKKKKAAILNIALNTGSTAYGKYCS